jgi:hypothetical protein
MAGDLAHQPFALLGERDDRRRGPRPLGVGQHLGLSPSMTATTELVVPRSIPMILDMATISFLAGPAGGGRLPGARISIQTRPPAARA